MDVLVGGTTAAGTADVSVEVGTGVELRAGATVAAGGFVFTLSGALRVAVRVGAGVCVDVVVTVGDDVVPIKPVGATALTGVASLPEVNSGLGASAGTA